MKSSRLVLLTSIALITAAPAFADDRTGHDGEERPRTTLAAANDASRQQPQGAAFQGARGIYAYRSGAIYEIYANPDHVSTLLLEPGETLNNIAAGDTARWMVTEATGGGGDGDGRTIVLIKPQAPGLRTNVVLITDRRTYQIEAVSAAGGGYSAEVAWSYADAAHARASAVDPIDHLNFAYRIRTIQGRTPMWAPVRVFDDGRRTFIEFGDNVVASEMPPLFVVSEEGAELVNYRVQGQRYVVDRVFDVGELRLGTRAPIVVRIERNPATRAVTSVHFRIHP